MLTNIVLNHCYYCLADNLSSGEEYSDSDLDKDYAPESDDSSPGSSEELEGTENETDTIEDMPENAIPPPRQMGKKRIRRVETWKQQRAKKLRNEGKKYLSRNQKVYDAKKLKNYNHSCRYNCNTNVPAEIRQAIFNDYWQLGTWDLQTSFLNGAIELEPIKRQKTAAISTKSVSCVYKLRGFRVCKEFFMKTLDVSNKRLQNVVNKKKITKSGIPLRDKRGRKEPPNKISQDRIEFIKEHINKFPRYSSHYSRVKAPNRRYFDSSLNLKKMYQLYQQFCEENNKDPVKESFYRHIFNTCFNLSFHRPATDTCVTCDKFQITIENGSAEEKRQAQLQKEMHLRKAEAARQGKNESHNNNDDSQVFICFDLQKTMPAPHMTNSKAYYCRQLWTYNLSIHDLVTGNAQMYIWHEGQASRGCQEIASCLWKFVKTLPPHVKHITAFSDNCGGQNKSHIIVKFWLYVIRNTHIDTVDHRFLLAGHSYNECDQDFGLVEIKKKNVANETYMYRNNGQN